MSRYIGHPLLDPLCPWDALLSAMAPFEGLNDAAAFNREARRIWNEMSLSERESFAAFEPDEATWFRTPPRPRRAGRRSRGVPPGAAAG